MWCEGVCTLLLALVDGDDLNTIERGIEALDKRFCSILVSRRRRGPESELVRPVHIQEVRVPVRDE
jgi:hypothetical protein